MIATLGLLGSCAITPTIFEPFRNPVNPSQIRSCLGKLFDVYADFRVSSKTRKQSPE